MSSSLRLPQDLHNMIEGAVAAAFQHGADSMGIRDKLGATFIANTSANQVFSETRAGNLSALAGGILDSVHLVLEGQLRLINARESMQARLPPELWCAVWEYLPFAARIAVSHTCSHWRTLALDCPSLWSHPKFYFAAHSPECECADCLTGARADSDPYEQPKGWADNPYADLPLSNVVAAPALLARSATLPLRLTIDIVAYHPNETAFLELGEALDDHRLRVVGLDVRCADPLAARALLSDAGGDWTALRDLSIEEVLNEAGHVNERCVVLPGDAIFPKLETVRLRGSCGWPSPEWEQTYPRVRSLVMQPHASMAAETFYVLLSCKVISALHLDFKSQDRRYSDDPTQTFDHRDLAMLTAALKTVHITSMPMDYEKMMLDIFHLPSRVELVLEYAERQTIGQGHVIFRDLGDGIHLRITCSENMLSVEGTDTNRRLRRVAMRVTGRPSRSDFTSVMSADFSQHCQWQRVVALRVNASLWVSFVEMNPVLERLAELEIVVDKVAIPWLENSQSHVQSLQSLTLISSSGLVTLSAARIRLFVRNLRLACVGSLISLLRIDHRLDPGNVSLLSGVARAVVVGVFHVQG